MVTTIYQIHHERNMRFLKKDACPKGSFWSKAKHKWDYSSKWSFPTYNTPYASFTNGASYGRSGWRCDNCGQIHWEQTDEEFFLVLIKHFRWDASIFKYLDQVVAERDRETRERDFWYVMKPWISNINNIFKKAEKEINGT